MSQMLLVLMVIAALAAPAIATLRSSFLRVIIVVSTA